MRLRRLRIDRLPGIGTSFEIDDLDAALTVVMGSNASGKSSLCRAVRALLYKEQVDGAVDLEAEFEDALGPIRVVRQGLEVVWTRDGQVVPPPALPDERMVSCFTIHLEQLLGAGETERRICDRIGQMLAGGYDLEEVRRTPGLDLRPRHGKKEDQALQAAERTLRETNEQQRGIRDQERKLERLREKKLLAARAVKNVEATRTAVELLVARRKVSAMREERSGFPDGMEKLTGDESERLASAKRTLARQTGTANELDREIENANEELSACGLASTEPSDAALADQRSSLDLWRKLEQERKSARTALDQANEALAGAVRDLGGQEPAHDLTIGPEVVRRVDRGLDKLRELTAETRAIDEQVALLESAAPGAAPLERLREARLELSRWLTGPEVALWSRGGHLFWILLLTTAALVGAGISGLRLHWAFALLALPVLGAAIPLLHAVAVRRDPRAESRSRYSELGFSEPEGWEFDSVRRRLAALEAEIAAGERAGIDAERRRGLERKREDLRARESEVSLELAALAADVGFDPENLDASLDRWVRLVGAYDDGRRRARERNAELTDLLLREDALRSRLSAFLAVFDESPIDHLAETEVFVQRLRALEARARRRDSARDDLNRAREAKVRVAREIEETQEIIDSLFLRAGMEGGNEADLESRLLLLGAWKRLDQELSDERAIARDTDQRLGDAPALRALVDDDDEAELRRRLEEAQELAEQHGDLASEVSLIEDRIRAARAGHDLEESRAAVHACREELRDRLAEDQFAEAAGFLLDDVQQEHVDVSRPAVLKRAEAWFSRFTNHAFALVVPARSNREFLARESSTAEIRTLGQLSSGTRMQLLLALRLAFALDAEQGREPLPFFLDEALTVSDPTRFHAVVESVHEFAREERRQLFYLTAQPQDLRGWTGPGRQPKRIRLDEVRRLAVAVTSPADLEPAPIEQVPSSEGLTASEYGAILLVPRIGLWAPAESVHLFHLLRDELPLLELLLRHGVHTIGQVRSLLKSEAAQAILTPEEISGLLWKTLATDAFLEAARRGRGRPVNRRVLEQAGVSANFIGRLASLAVELDGDGDALLRVIDDRSDERVKGFRAKQYDQLRDYFCEHDHVDPRPALSLQEIQLELLTALACDPEGGEVSHETVLDLSRSLAATVMHLDGMCARPRDVI